MSDPIVERARMLLEAGQYKQARSTAQSALAIDPDDLDALIVAGWAAELDDDHEAALRLIARPLAAAPDQPTLLALAAWARVGIGDVHGARDAARRRVELSPDDWGALCDLAGIDLRSGRSDATTLDAARRAVALAPTEPAPHARLGAVHLARKENRAARREFAETLRLDPTSDLARHDLAVVDLRRGGVVRAAGEFARLTVSDATGAAAGINLMIAVDRALWVVQTVLLATVLIVSTWAGTDAQADLIGDAALPVRLVGAGISAAVLIGAPVYGATRLGRTARGVVALLRRSVSASLWIALLSLTALAAMVAAVPGADAPAYTAARLAVLGAVPCGIVFSRSLGRTRR